MNPKQNRIFIHGLDGTSQGVKAILLRGLYPNMLIPDFPGNLDERLAQLDSLLFAGDDWIIIGSSFGGLMGTIFTCRHPEKVKKLVLLAPALIWPEFAADLPDPVDVPTVIYHGEKDEIIPLNFVRPIAEQVFTNLEFHAVDDDHGLHKTAHNLDWRALLDVS